MNRIVKKYFFIYFLLCTSIVLSQTDTSKTFGTIKISKQKDSTYIKAFSLFRVFAEQSKNSDPSYMTYVEWIQNSNPSYANDRLKLTEPSPDKNPGKFDYTGYFQNNEFTKDIKMRDGECDTVHFYVSVDKYGNVKFQDVLPVEKLGDATVVYSDSWTKKKYKIDVSHVKTSYAFAELTKTKWVPGKIQKLKKHPSKQKIKYTSSDGYAQGIITVIYSSTPFKD